MRRFAELPAGERAAFVREASARLDVSPVIAEKDFWVGWMLQQILLGMAPLDGYLRYCAPNGKHGTQKLKNHEKRTQNPAA